jgi:hypothetical protein
MQTCAETLFMDYHNQNQVAIKIIRIFNTHGPNMNPVDGRVVSNFIVQALQGQRSLICLYANLQTRFTICRFGRRHDPDDGFWTSALGPVNLGTWMNLRCWNSKWRPLIDWLQVQTGIQTYAARRSGNNANLILTIWKIREAGGQNRIARRFN